MRLSRTTGGQALTSLAGRTTRWLSRRLNASLPAPERPNDVPTTSAIRSLAGGRSPQEADWGRRSRRSELKRQWERDFRSNRAIQRDSPPPAAAPAKRKRGDFNPGLHAFGAFGTATALVTLGTGGVLYALGRRWQLEGYDDWKMFARYGLKALVAPLRIRERVESAMPEWARKRDDADEPGEGWRDLHSLIGELDAEWEEEQKRRDVELAEWVDARRRRGLQDFGLG